MPLTGFLIYHTFQIINYHYVYHAAVLCRYSDCCDAAFYIGIFYSGMINE